MVELEYELEKTAPRTIEEIVLEIRAFVKNATISSHEDQMTILIPYGETGELEIVLWVYPVELSMISNKEVFVYCPSRKIAYVKSRSTEVKRYFELVAGDITKWIYSTIN